MANDSGESEFGGIVSGPALRTLEAAGYLKLEELTHVREKDLLALHGFGPKGIRLLNAELAKRGQAVGSTLQGERE